MVKFCVVPGREPVRLSSLDGNIIIIGETPRTIPGQFVLEAKAHGCITDEELAKISNGVNPIAANTTVATAEPVTIIKPVAQPIAEAEAEPAPQTVGRTRRSVIVE